MSMGTRQHRQRQEDLWITHNELVQGPAHPFYQRLNELLDREKFDEFVEKECAGFYADNNGRPSLAPGMYFRLLLLGYFEGIDSERGIAWRAADSLGLRRFLRVGLDESTPDHSTISRTRRLIDVDTHRKVFFWVLGLLADRGLLKGKRIGIDATTLEANAALRSIVRRDSGESYEEFLKGLAKESGIETPTREDLARVDRKRKKKGSNQEWVNPHDRDARITKMKDGRTHLAHKAEHAVDMETGAIVAVTLQEAHQGDTTTVKETLAEAGGNGRAIDRAGSRESTGGGTAGEPGRHRRSGSRQGVPQRSGIRRDEGRRRPHLHSREEADGPAALGRQGRATTSRIREPPTTTAPRRETSFAPTRRTDRTKLRALLRHRWHAPNAPAQTLEYSEAAVDSRGSVQSELDPAQVGGRRNAAGVEKPHSPACFSVFVPISGLQRNPMGLPSGLNAFEAESVFKVPWLDSKLPLPKVGGFRHGLLGPRPAPRIARSLYPASAASDPRANPTHADTARRGFFPVLC